MPSQGPSQPLGAADLMTAPVHYLIDALQRYILFLDVLRQRGNQYQEHKAKPTPHVLQFEGAVIVDGRTLERPVNYGLVRISPPAGTRIDPTKRPIVVVDPRAGHGPGIGGFKAESEIGAALSAGHQAYFVGFLPEPVPGQTIEDVMRAEAIFVRKVSELHPEAQGRPLVIGNCQAGWQLLMSAAVEPESYGPILVAGTPLSYWAGVRGVNPMRYSGGLLGGSWLTALTSDLGNGRFDGGWLVANFESLNPANTIWTKKYNLWSKIDTEAPRFLEFERWWGGHVRLCADEIQYIVDNLFVGNRLASAELTTDDGTTIDLRNVRGPIICFCSRGDDITPPQQALGWITDLYGDVDDIRAQGQTIVYAIHDTAGHLGIFVSGAVARKEHQEFTNNVDLIDVLPPGLWEMILEPRTATTANPELVSGDWVARFEPRTLDHIRALGGNDAEDERRFATVRRVSEINLGLYRTFLQPWVRALANDQTAELLAALNPTAIPYNLIDDRAPGAALLAELAEAVRESRKAMPADSPLMVAQAQAAKAIEGAWQAWGELRDRWVEATFLGIYGQPWLQAAVGLRANDEPVRRRPGREPEHQHLVDKAIARLRAEMRDGGAIAATLRAVIYIGLTRGSVDERGFALVRELYAEHGKPMDLAAFKELLRREFLLLVLDQDAAVAAIPAMLPQDETVRADALNAIRRMAVAAGALSEQGQARLAEIERLFGGGDAAEAKPVRLRPRAAG